MVRLWAVLEVCCARGVEGCPPWVPLLFGYQCMLFYGLQAAVDAFDIMQWQQCLARWREVGFVARASEHLFRAYLRLVRRVRALLRVFCGRQEADLAGPRSCSRAAFKLRAHSLKVRR